MQISRFQQLPHSQASRQDCPLGRHWLLFLPGVVYNKGGALQTGAKILNRKPVPKSSASQQIIQTGNQTNLPPGFGKDEFGQMFCSRYRKGTLHWIDELSYGF